MCMHVRERVCVCVHVYIICVYECVCGVCVCVNMHTPVLCVYMINSTIRIAL